MEIYLDTSYYNTHIVVKDTNVHIEEDVEQCTYFKDENGKIDYTKTKRDISEKSLEMISRLIEDMAYYRKEDYNFSPLIRELLRKTPQEKREEIYKELRVDYIDIDQD